MSEHSNGPDGTEDAIGKAGDDRRNFLGKVGRFAAVTTPAVTMMLAAGTKSNAQVVPSGVAVTTTVAPALTTVPPTTVTPVTTTGTPGAFTTTVAPGGITTTIAPTVTLTPGVGGASDRRLKVNTNHLATLSSGLEIHGYQYAWGGPERIGVMAQNARTCRPNVVVDTGTHLTVRYDLLQSDAAICAEMAELGLEFRT